MSVEYKKDNSNKDSGQMFSRRIFLQSSFIAGIGLVSGGELWHEKNSVDCTYHEVRPAGASDKFLTITQLSDLHLKSIVYMYKKLAQRVNHIAPDVVVITGDSIDRDRDITMLDDFLSLLDRNSTKLAIMGNHEWTSGANVRDIEEVYKKHGCLLLINRSISFPAADRLVTITGIDSLKDGHPDIEAALHNVMPSANHILLGHCPLSHDIVEKQLENSAYTINLMLSGHTHGGQVNILGTAPMLPDACGNYVKGWYKGSQIPLYVSRGLGTVALPIRIGAAPEVATFKYFLT